MLMGLIHASSAQGGVEVAKDVGDLVACGPESPASVTTTATNAACIPCQGSTVVLVAVANQSTQGH